MKVLTYNTDSPKLIITSSSGYTRRNDSIEFEDNNHEEADTPMIHAVLSSLRNPANAGDSVFAIVVGVYQRVKKFKAELRRELVT